MGVTISATSETRTVLGARRIGFILAHLGAVAIVAGMTLSHWTGIRTRFDVAMGQVVRSVPLSDGGAMDLGFELTMTDFHVEHYELHPDQVEPADKRYVVGLRILRRDGRSDSASLSINHPVNCDGWRLLLMAYDTETEQSVTLLATRDPCRKITISGIWSVLVGVPLICLLTPRRLL